MPRKPIEIPPAAARSFVKDMRAYHATNNSIKKDEIAARQAWLLSEHLGPREKPLRLSNVIEMFVQMKVKRDGLSAPKLQSKRSD